MFLGVPVIRDTHEFKAMGLKYVYVAGAPADREGIAAESK